MSDLPAYPQRPQFYALKYLSWLIDAGVVEEVGCDGFALLTAIVLQEDRLRYKRHVNFWTSQLCKSLNVSRQTLVTVRNRVVRAGLLAYQPGARQRPAKYFTTGMDLDSDEILSKSLTQSDEILSKPLTQSNQNLITSIPIPIPNKESEKNRGRSNRFSDGDMETAQWMFGYVQKLNPDHKPPNFNKWAECIRLMRERDGRTDGQVRDLWHRSHADDFWQKNILCPDKLRKQFDQLAIKLRPASLASSSGEFRPVVKAPKGKVYVR